MRIEREDHFKKTAFKQRTVLINISAVSSVFEYGKRNRLIDFNPCIYFDPPKNALARERNIQ